MKKKVSVSIVIPVYNEANRLENCVLKVKEEIEKITKDYEIIIAEDGSTDGTDRVGLRLSKKDKRIRSIHFSDIKLGRGSTLRMAFKKAKGETICYMDADLATDIFYLRDLVKYSKKYDIVTGSRYIHGAYYNRPVIREIISKTYNWLIRNILGCDIYDSQCGFKSFSRRFVKDEIYRVKEKSWAWDTVILVEGYKKGYRIKEFPVKWMEKRGYAHSSSIERILKDFKIHGRVLFKLFLKWKLGLDINL